LKYNIRNKGAQGWIELVFNPRTRFEQYVSEAMRFIHPYLFFVTYRFHVEKAREAGLRVEDVYCNKFHKEPYVMHHLYAQYFHPDTLLERVRDVSFYRRPRTIFKGWRAPDWAQNQNMHGWDIDAYSRKAWDNAMHDLQAEWTPQQFGGQRQEPNPLQWFRFENWRGGLKDRLFYNEVPQMSWRFNKGHLLEEDTEAERDKRLYSFTWANQDSAIMFGMDTRTPEGAAAFQKEYEAMAEMAPEIIKKEDMVMPHEMKPKLSEEPHFQRVWTAYREHEFKLRFSEAVEQGKISEEDANKFTQFVGQTSHPSFGLLTLAMAGHLDHLTHDEGYQATMRCLKGMDLGHVSISKTTATPPEEQFWLQVDEELELTEVSMRQSLPLFISDPSNRAKVEALLAEGDDETTLLPADAETTRRIA
jgi:hypothetical protein